MTREKEEQWKPRYLTYCRAHDQPDPAVMLFLDEDRHPGGKMAGYILWMGYQHRKFYAAHPEAFVDRYLMADYAAWDKWLQEAADNRDIEEL